MIKVSVIVPVYNAAVYLRKCLDSVVNQTLRDIEIIIINDGSTDNSDDICKQYLSDPRMIYYEKNNEGLAAARQDGIERASGEYIGFVDSDDWLEPNMYERMYDEAKAANADIAFCSCYENESKEFKPYLEAGAYDRNRIVNDILPNTLSPYDGHEWTKTIRWSNVLRIYKKSMIDKYHLKFGRKFRRCQDLPFTFEATLCAERYVYVDEYLYHNRVVYDSLSRGYTKNMWPLLAPLIQRLYADCEDFTEMDLSKSMNACSFMFVVNSIGNELKKENGRHIVQRIKTIDMIVNDDICRECLDGIEHKDLPDDIKKYYLLIRNKASFRLFLYTWRNEVLKIWWKKTKKQIAKNKLAKAVYHLLRKLQKCAVIER